MYSETFLSHQGVVVLSNSDIFYDESIGNLHYVNLHQTGKAQVYSISRYEQGMDGRLSSFYCHDFSDGGTQIHSADTFVWEPPLKAACSVWDNALKFLTPELGTFKIENNFVSVMTRACQFTVSNPCYSIITHHLHSSDDRSTSGQPIQSAFYAVIPPDATLHFDNVFKNRKRATLPPGFPADAPSTLKQQGTVVGTHPPLVQTYNEVVGQLAPFKGNAGEIRSKRSRFKWNRPESARSQSKKMKKKFQSIVKKSRGQ